MAVLTIAGLTLKEAVRRRTFLGALLIGLLILGLSLLLLLIRAQMQASVTDGSRDIVWYAVNYPIARSVIMALCLSSIRVLGSIFAILLAGGSISGEIERGLLAIILPKPIPRWHILLGKWIGLNVILAGSVLAWGLTVWASLSWQTRADLSVGWQPHADLSPLIPVSLYLTLFPIVICTLTLTMATVAPRLVGTSLALVLSAFSWFDGILNALGTNFQVKSLHHLANFASVLMPQGCIAWWIKDATDPISFISGRADFRFGVSPQFVKEWGATTLHLPNFDALYLVVYIIVVFLIGVVLFERRDV
jgi:ABC-type transport system involved in multi-copper enzyme maturation permease subunit